MVFKYFSTPLMMFYTLWSKMDPRRPKFQCSRNWTKPAPSCRTRRVDSDNMFFFENGRRMEKLWRSEMFPKHAKNSKSKSTVCIVDVNSTSTWQGRWRQHDDMLAPEHDMCQEFLAFLRLSWRSTDSTRGLYEFWHGSLYIDMAVSDCDKWKGMNDTW